VDRIEQQLGHELKWSAWAHRDTANPHAHLILRTDGLSTREVAQVERAIHDAARDAYADIRERQREYAREQQKRREREEGPER
jgi:type IV secretory pathway VirD2 relaxase